MGSYAGLHIANSKEIIWWKNGLSPFISSLFAKDELHRATGTQGYDLLKKYGALTRYVDLKPEDIEGEIVLAIVDVGTLKQRLAIYGYNKAIFDEVLDSEIDRLKEWISDPDERFGDLKDAWTEDVRQYESIKRRGISLDKVSYKLFEKLGLYDEFAQIWATIQHKDIKNSDSVVINLDDLIEGGWLDDELENEDSNFLIAPSEVLYDMPIIITEGDYDKKVLEKSLAVIYPKLVHNVRFLDMDFKPEGGVDSVIKMVKSFAAAGINNRILVVLDNDSAAKQAVLNLRNKRLPSNIKVVHYPEIDLLKRYPTIGPQGDTEMDVNGLAGSIEMYMGKDVLVGVDGKLEPIQWGGYMNKVKKYQGSLINKSLVQKRFEKKDFKNVDDWSDLRAVWDYIILELSKF